MKFIYDWISSILGLAPKQKEIKQQKKILQGSPLFDADYYKSRYLNPGRIARLDPLKHYLTIGANQLFNPGPEFDTAWYLEQNPDVRQSGVNPLYHFILFGEVEGRSPVPEIHEPERFSSPVVCYQKLWAGFSHLALPRLEAHCADPNRKVYRMQALWYLASWHYVHGQIELALKLLVELEKLQGRLTRPVLVSKCKCLLALGSPEKIADIVFDEKARQILGKEAVYIEINSLDMKEGTAETRWLELVNSLYQDNGLTGVQKADRQQPLSLSNLASTEECSTASAHIGDKHTKVSVIVPAYNAAETIGIALNSLVNQTWPNLEILVVDDASTDGTEEVVEEFTRKYPKIHYMRNPENLGAYPTRNQGYLNSTGDFITVHDSDDWSHPQKIEFQVEALLADSSLVATLSNWVRISDKLAFTGPWMLCEDFVEKNHSSALIRRSAIEQTGPWDEVNVAGDTEFLWRLEKVYGRDSLLTVKQEVPLSFALTLDSSLTQNQTTHVKTIYYGLRRLYREAAAWWHTAETDNLYLDPAQRKFPCPLGNSRQSESEFDVIVAGDFSTANPAIDELINYVRDLALKSRVVLFHWPDYRSLKDASIAPQVFEFCQAHGLTFTHAGNSLKAAELILVDRDLAQWVPDNLPRVEALEHIRILGETSDEQANRIKHLFLADA